MRLITPPQVVTLIGAIILTITCQAPHVYGANILGLFTSSSPSHLIVHMSVAKALAEKGHNVTVVTGLKPKVTHKSIHNILIPPSAELEAAKSAQLSQMATQKNSVLEMLRKLDLKNSPLVRSQFDIMKDERFTKLYDGDTKFDLIIMGYFFNDFVLAAGAKLKCPIIVNWMSVSLAHVDNFVGNPHEVAYVPNFLMTVKDAQHMNFMQRLKNYLIHLAFKTFSYVLDYVMEGLYNELIPSDSELPSYDDMKKNVSLVFCNNHLSEGPIRPFVPAMVEIGGIQIKQKPDPLPKDIDDFLGAAKKHGAILLSLGSNIKSSTLKPAVIQAIFKTFSSSKQNVIWKWEDLDNLPGNSPNVLFKKWLPQDDILAHPNLRIFITHAGKGGIAEAQYHGVPMLALPVFGDQMTNADKVTSAGYGLNLELQEVTEHSLKAALEELLNNPLYAQNVKKFSQLYKDRPMTAKESVVFWSEYVIRHHGAAHMQSPLVHLNGIQSSSLDVLAFLCVILYIVWRVLKLIVCLVYRLVYNVFSAKRITQKTKVKKQ